MNKLNENKLRAYPKTFTYPYFYNKPIIQKLKDLCSQLALKSLIIKNN